MAHRGRRAPAVGGADHPRAPAARIAGAAARGRVAAVVRKPLDVDDRMAAVRRVVEAPAGAA
jgi:hypothetical protein